MDRANISFENISLKEYLELLNLEEMPELGDEIELTQDLKVYNRTLAGIGFTETVAFQLIYPIVAGVSCNLLTSYLLGILKNKPFVKVQVNGYSIKDKSEEEIEKIIKNESINEEQDEK